MKEISIISFILAQNIIYYIFLYNIIYALKSSYISNVYISTDDENIISYKEKYDIKIIKNFYKKHNF